MAASAPSQYLLRWNDHLSNYGDIFLSLRDQEEFVDCSIACEDGMVGAHRVVLAGCSPYLRDLFARVANPHPVIFLLNTSRSLVLMLMEFIYRGQVHVPQHRLQQLVALGHALKIKGLTQMMMPVSSAPSDISTSHSSITTPLAFPHGLPLTSTSSLPFTTIANNTCNLDISLLSCTNGEETVEEEHSEGDKLTELKERKTARQKRPYTPSQPRRRKRLRKPLCYNKEPERVKATSSPPDQKPPTGIRKSDLPLYANVKERSRLGAYALQHGIDATRRHILEKYSVKMRRRTIQHLIVIHEKYEAKKNAKRNHKQGKKEASRK